jgi:hypothetical protein
MEKICLQCETVYKCRLARAVESKFCSTKCRFAYEKIHGRIVLTEEERKKRIERRKIPTLEFVCIGCGVKFKATTHNKERIYCTRECGMKHIGHLPTNPWNKDLTKDSDHRLKQMGANHSKWLKEQYESGELNVWNKGLTAETDERMKALTEHLTILRNTDGDWKEKWRESMRKGQVKAWAEGKYNRPITDPEQKTWNYLESIGYNVKWFRDISDDDFPNTWYFQFPFFDAFVPDFACPDLQCIIEVNGCAVHGHDLAKCNLYGAKYGWTDFAQKNSKRDRQKYSMYHRKEWKWALVWQCEADNKDFHRLHSYLHLMPK